MSTILGSGLDSTVFLEETWTSVLKRHRWHITLSLLQDYHSIHNSLSEQEFWFDWSPEIDVSYTITGIQRIVIQVLTLGNTIFEENWVVNSRVPYVPWDIIYSYWDDFKSQFVWYMRSLGLNFQIQDTNTFDWIEKFQKMWDPWDFSPSNIKIHTIEWGILRLIITDLGTYIPFFVHCYKERVANYSKIC